MSHIPYPSQAAFLAALAMALSAAACVPGDLDMDSVMVALVETPKCEDVDCGQNGPYLEGFPLRELNTAGPNEDGYQIYNFFNDDLDRYLTLDVENGEFIGRDPNDDVVASGEELVGDSFMFSNGIDYWDIKIAGYTDALEYWGNVAGATLSAYRLQYRRRGGRLEWKDLCKDPVSVRSDPNWLAAGGYETYAILIPGERYDAKAITVRQDAPAENWVTIACAGTGLAKMMLMGYNPMIPEGDAYHTTWEERQATIKMITADVCGSGNPFTIPGRRLLWANDAGWHTVDNNDVDTVEAVWAKDGALCLDTPRLEGHEEYENIVTEIELECGTLPPSCAHPAMSNWIRIGEWKTYNPFPEEP
jgi:hypothetical protein